TPIAGDLMPAYEAGHLQSFVLGLVLDAGQALRRRAIVGHLEDTAQQYRHVFELHSRALFDFRNNKMAQIGIGTAEVEVKFYLGHGFTISLRRDGSPARMSTRRAAAGKAANTPRPPLPAS